MPGINVHLYPSDILHESRMMRMTKSVASSGHFDRIDLVGHLQADLAAEEDIDSHRRVVRLEASAPAGLPGGLGRLGLLWNWNRRIVEHYRDQPVRMVNPHVVWALPAARKLKAIHGVPLVYDTHELETETIGSHGARQQLSRWIERRAMRDVDAIHVVSHGIEDWYRRTYDFDEVHTIKNYPLGKGPRERTTVFRDTFEIPDDHLVFCYQGRLSRSDEVDLLFDVFSHLPEDRHLVFMGFGPLVDRIEREAAARTNLHFHPGVDFLAVPRYTSSADVALVFFEDACLSYHHVLPNKLLESLNAGVPVVVSDLPDMVREIHDDDAGWVTTNDRDAIVGLLASLDRETVDRKARGAAAWSARNHWDVEADRMLDIYARLLAAPANRGGAS